MVPKEQEQEQEQEQGCCCTLLLLLHTAAAAAATGHPAAGRQGTEQPWLPTCLHCVFHCFNQGIIKGALCNI